MTDIKLPPLPEWMSNYTIPADGFECDKNVMLVDRMHDYARAAVLADRIKKEDYINDDRDMLRAEIVALKGTVADLQAECEKLRRDAERYRCLSSMATQQADYLGPIFRIDVRRSEPYLFNFDAAIDAAMSKEGSHDTH